MKVSVDSVLEDSFPASDPPSWTLGVEAPTGEKAAQDPVPATDPGPEREPPRAAPMPPVL
jgi:hypothetical protein